MWLSGVLPGAEPQAEQPVSWLPRIGNKLAAHVEANAVIELRDIPDALLNDQQRRVEKSTLSGRTYFDQQAAARRWPA